MLKTLKERSAGLLCHISSLPGPWASGDLGPQAHEFIRFLSQAGQSWWQMLPCHPTGAGDSPYQALSAFAGNPLFISLELLHKRGWLEAKDLLEPRPLPEDRANMGAAFEFRFERLRKAHVAFSRQEKEQPAYKRFCDEEASWLDDWALFAAIKRSQGGKHWVEWGPEVQGAQVPAKRDALRQALAGELAFEKFAQYLFDLQWKELKAAANAKGVGLIGDLPIFVAHDSADVWAKSELFDLNAEGQPSKVAGVPPDYFSADGQRWGNPLYRWDLHANTGYAWWIARFKRALKLFDAVRVDHFIGFYRYWEIPAESLTAREGQYVLGPGADFFEALKARFPAMPIIAEDLGVLTPEVTALRQRYEMPGMRVMQFSFGGEVEQLPDRFSEDTVVYTGTHDNDTSAGWMNEQPTEGISPEAAEGFRAERRRAVEWGQSHSDETGQVWPLIASALETKCRLGVIPLQDLLELGTESRMNMPGTVEGNWCWRAATAALTPALAARLRRLVEKYGRI